MGLKLAPPFRGAFLSSNDAAREAFSGESFAFADGPSYGPVDLFEGFLGDNLLNFPKACRREIDATSSIKTSSSESLSSEAADADARARWTTFMPAALLIVPPLLMPLTLRSDSESSDSCAMLDTAC
jgi:hypothetical protein